MFSLAPKKFDVHAFLQFRVGKLPEDPDNPFMPDYRIEAMRQAEARAAIVRAEEETASAIREAETHAHAKRETKERSSMLRAEEETKAAVREAGIHARMKREAEERSSMLRAEEETKAAVREAEERAIREAIYETTNFVVQQAFQNAVAQVNAKFLRDAAAVAVTTITRETASLWVNKALDDAIEQANDRALRTEEEQRHRAIHETASLVVQQALQDAIELVASEAKERAAKTIHEAASLIVDEVVPQATELATTNHAQPRPPKTSPVRHSTPNITKDRRPQPTIHPSQERMGFAFSSKKIEALMRQSSPTTNPLISAVLNETKRLKDEGQVPLDELTNVLDKTHELVTSNPTCTQQDYQSLALQLQNKPSNHWKALSGMMLALALAIATLGVVFAPAAVLSLGIAATVATETAVGVTALFCAVKGYGLFAKGNHQTNTLKAMSAQALKTTTEHTVHQPEANQGLSVSP